MDFVKESRDTSTCRGGKLEREICLNAGQLLVPAHYFAFSPGILTSLKIKSMCSFSVWQLECQHQAKQGFVWETDCSTCNLLVYHLSGTHIWSSSCSELTGNQSQWCTGSVENLTENNIMFLLLSQEMQETLLRTSNDFGKTSCLTGLAMWAQTAPIRLCSLNFYHKQIMNTSTWPYTLKAKVIINHSVNAANMVMNLSRNFVISFPP